MLPPVHRLIKEKDFKYVYKYGRVYFSPLLILKFAKNNLKNSRFGFVVGNKISKKSTVRNKIKRFLRAIIKAKFQQIKTCYDYIFIVRQAIIEKKYVEIEQEIERLLKKSRQIK